MMTVVDDELIRFACPACGKRLKSPVEHQGKRARCRCGERVIVPGGEPVDAEVVDEPFHRRFESADRWTTPVSALPAIETRTVSVPSPAHNPPESQSFMLQYKATASQLWDATINFVGTLTDLVVLERNDTTHELRYRSQHFKLVATIRITEPGPGLAEVNFQLARQATTAQDAAPAKIELLDLIVFTSYKTQALDSKFKQVGGSGGTAEVRTAGVWKMVWGGLIGIVGLFLTAMTDGQVLFYGAILTGGFMFIAGAIQAVIGMNVE